MTSPSSSIFCSFSATAGPLLGRDDVDRLGALLTLARLELDFRSLGQRLEAVASDVGVMHEEILPAVLRRDESVSLGIVEPLDGSGCHVNLPCFSERTSREGLESATGTRPDYRNKVAATLCRRAQAGAGALSRGSSSGNNRWMPAAAYASEPSSVSRSSSASASAFSFDRCSVRSA